MAMSEWIETVQALQGKSQVELEALGFVEEEIQMMEIYMNPVKWAAAFLDWSARDYQLHILDTIAKGKQIVLRLGRRLGKTECMCVSILWHAMLQPNKGPNNQYDILIITPYEAQIDLIFERLYQLIDMSPEIKASVERNVHHQLSLHNGTNIKGQTASTKNSTGAASTRGQRADLIILDECDYLNDNDITNILNIRNEAPERIKIIAASTPSGRRSSYYKWCTGAPTNGWRECYAPSTVNPELLKTNKDTGKTYLEELKEELTEARFVQEVMAEFGEEARGVYLKVHLDKAVELGHYLNIEYEHENFARRGPRILGVDWDKMENDTNMVGVQYIEELAIFAPFVRAEIPRNEFTYDNAVKRIIELNNIYDFDYIAVDAGHGEMQIEQLKLYGLQNPESGLQRKVVRVNFSEKVTVHDPVTKIRDKKDIKPFMVNNTVLLFERNQIAFNPSDRKMIKQFEEYRVERIGLNGRPVYSSNNEHIHDCVMLAVHMFNMKFNDTFKVKHASLISRIDAFKKTTDNVISRRNNEPVDNPFQLPKNSKLDPAIPAMGIRMMQKSGNYQSTRGMGRNTSPTRRKF